MADATVKLGRSLMVAGRIASGKTSLAKVLSHRLGVRRVSFGPVIRGMLPAARSLTRRRLQDHGQRTIEARGADWLLHEVLERCGVPTECEANVVFDGVRHKSMVDEIRSASRMSCLVFVDARPHVRLHRYAARSHADISMEAFNQVCGHRAESELGRIRRMADCRVNNSEDGLVTARIRAEKLLRWYEADASSRASARPVAKAAPACDGRISVHRRRSP